MRGVVDSARPVLWTASLIPAEGSGDSASCTCTTLAISPRRLGPHFVGGMVKHPTSTRHANGCSTENAIVLPNHEWQVLPLQMKESPLVDIAL